MHDRPVKQLRKGQGEVGIFAQANLPHPFRAHVDEQKAEVEHDTNVEYGARE